MSPCFFPIISATHRWMRKGLGWLGLKNKEVMTKQSDHQSRMECPVSAFSPQVWSPFSTLDCQPDPNSNLIFLFSVLLIGLKAFQRSWGILSYICERWNMTKWRWILDYSMLVQITTTPRRNDLLETQWEVGGPAGASTSFHLIEIPAHTTCGNLLHFTYFASGWSDLSLKCYWRGLQKSANSVLSASVWSFLAIEAQLQTQRSRFSWFAKGRKSERFRSCWSCTTQIVGNYEKKDEKKKRKGPHSAIVCKGID